MMPADDALPPEQSAPDSAPPLVGDRDAAEQHLRESEAILREILDHAAEGIITIDERGIVNLFNAGAAQIFGYAADEVVGRNISMLMPSPDREQHDDYLARYRTTGQSRVIGPAREVRAQRRDGSLFPMYLAVSEVHVAGRRIFTGIVRDISASKGAEEALRDSKERLDLALKGANLGIWDWSFTTGEIFYDDRAAAMQEYALSEIQSEVQVVHPKDVLECVRRLMDHVEGRTPFYVSEHRLQTKSGGWRWVLAHGRVVARDAEGHALRMVGTRQDISRRKRSEQLVAVQHAVTRVLAEAATRAEAVPKILQAVGVALDWDVATFWTADANTRKVTCASLWTAPNVAAETFTRATHDASFEIGAGLPGSVWASRVPSWIADVAIGVNLPRGRAAAQDGLHAAMATPICIGDTVFGVLELFSSDIREPDRETLDMLAALGSQIGQFLERTRSAEALRESEERYRRLIEISPDAIVLTDVDARILLCNEQAAAIAGETREGLIGRDALALLPSTDKPRALEDIRQLLAAGSVHDVEYTVARADGATVPLEISASMVRDRNSQPQAFILVARDITTRKHAQHELAQAKDAAEAASQAKSRFLATMSHEIRTPLNPIIGTTGLLLSAQLEPAQRRHVERIRQAGRLLLQRINDILDFSKIDAHRVELEELDFDVVAMLDQVRELFAHQAQEQGLALRVGIAPDVPRMVRADPSRLRQILVNLVANAVKFTDRGTIEICLFLVSAAAGGKNLRFEVHDTGIGVPADKQATLFEAFTQADASTTRNYGGSGLGLAIAHELVQLMGGRIGMESTSGQGSCFWLTVPFFAAASGGSQSRKTVAATRLETQGRQPPSRILVAEDNPANQEIMSLMLERLGHHVDLAGNGVEAVAAYRRSAYDVVLMDCQMPELDGFAATGEIRHLEDAGRHTPIIAMTAYAFKGDRERCLAAGMDDYLSKPVQFEELIPLLDKWLLESRTVRQLEAVDRSVLDSLRRLESPKHPKLVENLITHFLEQAPERIASMRRTLAEQDWPQLSHLAHDLKAESGNLGVRTMSALCDELQIAARQCHAERCTALLPRVVAEFEDARRELTAVLAG